MYQLQPVFCPTSPCVGQAPTSFNSSDLRFCVCVCVTNWLWGIYNWCTDRKIISAKLPPWPARGTWHAPRRIALSNRIFPGQCKLWQIPSSCIMHFMLIFLIRENREGLLFCWRARCLIEWWWKNIRKPPPPLSNPSCDHLCPKTTMQPFLL